MAQHRDPVFYFIRIVAERSVFYCVYITELYLYIWRLRSYTFVSQKVKPKTWRPRDVKRVIDITVYLFSGDLPLTTASDRDFKVFTSSCFQA